MKILGIETSCDETALSIIKVDESNKEQPVFELIKSVVNSQIEIHKNFGGVFPSVAKREHAKNLIPLLIDLLDEQENIKIKNKTPEIDSEKKIFLENLLKREQDLYENFINILPNIKKPDIDLIAVTSGPGLEPALWVGINFAIALSYFWKIPMIEVNHMKGHISSVFANPENKINFPSLSLLISGGHTELVLMKNWNEYELLGQTRDDAVGEVFDKTARILGFSYPGGPIISKLAQEARDKNLKPKFKLPRPMINSKDLNFSFSGLKTAVLYLVQNLKKEIGQDLSTEIKSEIALEFENAVTEVLIKKTKDAIEKTMVDNLIIGGGVIANNFIRDNFVKLCSEKNIKLLLPTKDLATDNATMIAISGFFETKNINPEIGTAIIARGNLKY